MNLFKSIFNWVKSSKKEIQFRGFKTDQEKNDFEKLEKEFLLELNQIFKDIQESIKVLGEAKSQPLIKSQLCMVFICADTFSRIFKILEGAEIEQLDEQGRERFMKWFNNFVFTDDNDIYKKHKNKIRCNSKIAWQLRNAALHFYGLPDPKKTGGKRIIWFNGDEQTIDRIERGFANANEDVRVMNQGYFADAVLWGLLAQLNFMKQMIKESPIYYVERIKIAHEILRQQGAKVTQVNNKKVGS